MTLAFGIGLLGSLILVTASAWPIKPVRHPAQAPKNWLYAVGGLFMFSYSLINFWNGGSIFFVFLQVLVNTAGALMLLNVPERLSKPLIVVGGLILTIWSLSLFKDTSTILFIIGLVTLSWGYVLNIASANRYIALTIGSALVALFSTLQGDMIFFWLNFFFAVFSATSVWKLKNK